MSDSSGDGESEEQVVARLAKLLAIDEDDNIRKIKTVYQPIGREIDIASERQYFEAMGLRGWFWAKFKRSETHARECWRCWKDRDVFDRALDWWRTGNTDFSPDKQSGPKFSNELCKAYRDRMLSDADKNNRRGRGRGMTAKQLKEALTKWHHRYMLVRDEHVEWAEQDQRESRVLNLIEREIAAEEAAAAGVDIDADSQHTPGVEPDEAEPEVDPEPDPEPPPQASQPVIEPEPEPQPKPMLLLPAPMPQPELPDIDDDTPDDQPHDDEASVICLPDASQPGPDIQAAIERLKANPHIRAQETYQRIMGTRLPRVRKLARVQQLIAEMYDGVLNSREIDFARFWDDYGEGIDFIRRAMKTDSPKFSQMGTFKDYLDRACALAGDEAAKEKGRR
jgi:hypothetical protein